jgi:hypothetical protein
MAGTIFGLPLSQQFIENGEPMSGGKLYLYEAGTSTPATTYESFSLTAGTELSFPIELDSSGRIPEFWVDDGSYRVRLTDVDGNEIFDINSTTALGASSGGAGTGDSVSDASIFQTGDLMWQPVNGTRSGWVRANSRTIGSSSSGATERANADCETLFLFLWNNFDNTLCPVGGGRGGSAASDWAANKVIGTLDMRGRLAYGMDTMGTSAAAIVAGATTAGGALGQEEKEIVQGNLPSGVNLSHSLTAATHTHTGGSLAVGTSITNGTNQIRAATGGSNDQATAGGDNNAWSNTLSTSTISLASGAVSGTSDASGALAVSGTVSLGGSGTAFDTLSPGRAGSWYFRL